MYKNHKNCNKTVKAYVNHPQFVSILRCLCFFLYCIIFTDQALRYQQFECVRLKCTTFIVVQQRAGSFYIYRSRRATVCAETHGTVWPILCKLVIQVLDTEFSCRTSAATSWPPGCRTTWWRSPHSRCNCPSTCSAQCDVTRYDVTGWPTLYTVLANKLALWLQQITIFIYWFVRVNVSLSGYQQALLLSSTVDMISVRCQVAYMCYDLPYSLSVSACGLIQRLCGCFFRYCCSTLSAALFFQYLRFWTNCLILYFK